MNVICYVLAMEQKNLKQKRISAGVEILPCIPIMRCSFVAFRYGRVNFILALRLELLGEVKRLQVCVVCYPPRVVSMSHYLAQDSLEVGGDVSYTCETAGHFYLYQVLSRWEAYMSKVKPLADTVSGH